MPTNNIRNMHLDFKSKLNKIDSVGNRNLRVPEIDWVLNEALRLYIDINSVPSTFTGRGGLGSNQTTSDILAPLVKYDTGVNHTGNSIELPVDYFRYLSGIVECSKTGSSCDTKKLRLIRQQIGDKFEDNFFTEASFEWGEVPIVFYSGGIKMVIEDASIVVQDVFLTYIKEHPYIHAAEDYQLNTYTLPDGTALEGYENCLLPTDTHSKIVDLAVLIMTGNLQIPDYQVKLNKLNLKNTLN